MEDHAARPEPGVGSQDPLQQRLEQLEREAAELRRQLEGGPASEVSEKSDELTAPIEVSEEVDATPEEPEAPPPTREQLDQAENFIRQARLARSRGLTSQANEFLAKAEAAAPTSPIVLEFIGDDNAERGQYRKAKEAYQKALTVDPKNAAIERKYGMMVLKADTHLNLAMYSDYEVVANAKRATILTCFLPGLGQLVTGEKVKGSIIMALWVGTIVLIRVLPNGVKSLMELMTANIGARGFDMGVLGLAAFALLLHIGAIVDSSMKAKSYESIKILHPEPPEKLPFE